MTLVVLMTLPSLALAASGDTMPSSTGSMAPAMVASPLNEALNVTGSPKLVSQTATSVTLEWSKVSVATSYIVKYSKSSVADAFKKGNTAAVYEVETDPVTATGTTIKDLKADTTYYFAVVALDKDKNESPTNSEELSVKLSGVSLVPTASGSTTPAVVATPSSFKLVGVTVVNEMTLALDFNAPVSAISPVSVKIIKTSDKTSLSQKSAVVDTASSQKVIVTLQSPLVASSTYSATIIQAKDTAGALISEGVNAIKEFSTTTNVAKVAVAATTNSGVSLNAAPESMSGAMVAAEALPATGTKENLLLLLAAIIAFGIVFFARRKSA